MIVVGGHAVGLNSASRNAGGGSAGIEPALVEFKDMGRN